MLKIKYHHISCTGSKILEREKTCHNKEGESNKKGQHLHAFQDSSVLNCFYLEHRRCSPCRSDEKNWLAWRVNYLKGKIEQQFSPREIYQLTDVIYQLITGEAYKTCYIERSLRTENKSSKKSIEDKDTDSSSNRRHHPGQYNRKKSSNVREVILQISIFIPNSVT